MYDIITIGSATRDVFLVSKAFKLIRSPKFTTGIGECVSLGSKIELDDLILTTGGGGTNSAATFASLGLNTAVVTKIGDDESGRDVLNDLKKFKVKTTLITKVKGGDTGYSVLLTESSGERTALVHRGVSGTINKKDIPFSKLKSKWIYISSLAGNVSLAMQIVRHAKKHGIKVAYNPGGAELKKGLRALSTVMRGLTILNLNLEEAQLLAKSKTRDVAKICKKIARPGLMLIITDGPNGAYAYLDGTTWFARAGSAKSLSRTGAGDAFGAATVAALAKDKGIDEALKIGTLNAESVIQLHGAKNGILKSWPTKKQLKKIKVRTTN